MSSYSQITSSCFVNAPFTRLTEDDLLRTFIDHKIQPEIGLEGNFLYDTKVDDYENLSRLLKDAGLKCTLHAPFYDLSPGALDRGVRLASLNKLRLAFELIEIFEPVAIVCHVGFENNKHLFKQEEWLENSLATWQELLSIAAKSSTPMMLENTYETEPEPLVKVLKALDSPHARFCLDVGHVLSFAKNSWGDWLPAMSPWLGQLHLHDNKGDMDNHLAIGQGNFDFAGLFSYLNTNNIKPIITLEPHQKEGLWQSLAALDKMVEFKEMIR